MHGLRLSCFILMMALIGGVQAETTSEAVVPPAPPVLDGTQWRLVAYRVDGALIEPETENPPRIDFADGRVAGHAGCNSFSSAFTQEDDRLEIDPRMAMTMMACEPPLMALEQAITAHLVASTRLRLDGDRLTLSDAEGTDRLVLAPPVATPLTGVIWRLDAYQNAQGALVTPRQGSEITLSLALDGTLGGSDGCNHYRGGYTLDGDRLMIGPIATTRMACRGPAALAEQAADYLTALGRARAHRIEHERLLLTTDDGATVARFERVQDE